MRALGLEPVARLAPLAPLAARVIVGVIMFVHGLQKLTQIGVSNFGQALSGFGVPLPGFMAYVVTFAELIGGALLIVGLLSRLAALVLTIDLVVAILLVKTGVGLIAPPGTPGAGAELDLALIAGLLVTLFAGPGKLSLDYALGLEREPEEGSPSRASRA